MKANFEKISKTYFTNTLDTDKLNINHPFKSDLHFHSLYEIFYLERGTRNYIINGKLYPITKGTIVLISPGIIHATNGSSFKRRLVHFDKKVLESVFNDEYINSLLRIFSSYVIKLNNEDCEKILFYIDQASNYYLTKNMSGFAVATAGILNLLQSSTQHHAAPTQIEIINLIISFLQNNFYNITSLEEIANHFFMDKYYICHIFKKQTKTTIFEFLNKIRIEHAAHLLINTNKSITTISKECGFNSVYYFSRKFTTSTGINPIQYRKAFKST